MYAFIEKLNAWKVPKYRVFSGPYFPVFGLRSNLRIQSECRKIRAKKLRIWILFTQWLIGRSLKNTCYSVFSFTYPFHNLKLLNYSVGRRLEVWFFPRFNKWKWVVKFPKICNRLPQSLTITLPRLPRAGNVDKIF